jgi:hypothetical protein
VRNLKNSWFPLLLVTVLLLVYYSTQIIGGDSIVYGLGGDGYKNYYTLAYYLKYDSGVHFTGMNYPFGENIIFTDNQPLVAWTLKTVSLIFPAIKYHIHGYLAWAIFLSIIISAYFLFKTLQELRVGNFHAALFAVLIAMMSPQIRRLISHFSLGYTCFIPILLFALIRFFKSGNPLKPFFAITVIITCFSFIHIYYLGMAGLFLLLTSFFFAIIHRQEIKKVAPRIGLLISAALIPVLVLKLYLLITDPITDRPKAPWGFVESRSTLADIFLSPNSFTGQIASKIIPPERLVYHGEGLGYIGLVTTLTLFLALLLITRKFFLKKGEISIAFPLNILLPASTVVLLFAMAFPFNLDAFEEYYHYLPAIVKQFRASGRFNWIFYYVSTLTSAVLIFQLFKTLSTTRKWVAYSFLTVIYSIWFVELNMTSVRLANEFSFHGLSIDEESESHSLLTRLQASGKALASFQAIFPLPFFLAGSEKLLLESCSMSQAMKASLFTGLPLSAGQMSRTSESQTFKIANLMSSDITRKEVITEYPNSKPLLLMTVGNDFTPQEQKIIGLGKYLFAIEGIKYFELPLSAFADNQDSIKKYFALYASTFYNSGHYRSSDSIRNVVALSFDDSKKDYAVFGPGALYSEHNNVSLYFDTLPQAKDSTEYEFSIWLYADNRRPAFPTICLTQTDENGKEIVKVDLNGMRSTNTFGKWVRIDMPFFLYNRRNKVCVTGSGNYASYDELMIRPRTIPVITAFMNDSSFMYDNFPIR